MDFAAAWDLPIGTWVKVRDGNPPPSTNKEGIPYQIWWSHNFTGKLEEKIDFEGWRSIKFMLDNKTTHETMIYAAFTVQEEIGHAFELV